ncbi:response regulator [Aquimarina sp. AU474]|uniref:response regulator n=1 Tax=Aquimarina sp. AU474 TaxID=2108529 RepID=UPI000D688D94|nr:response regulator [Aquimarina sp. AU474]
MENKVKHMLLIDDSNETNTFNKRIIERTGLTKKVSVARNGVEALSYFDSKKNSKDRPEIVFLDLNMPIMDGWEFLDHYNQLGDKNSIVILMLSSDLLPGDHKKLKDYTFIKRGSEKVLNRLFLHDLVDNFFS